MYIHPKGQGEYFRLQLTADGKTGAPAKKILP
jgi:hypothetical protein